MNTEPATKKRILLVEDEVNLRELMKFRLEEAGYEVLTAGDGLMAVSLARTQKPDVILLDLMLPKLDGYTVCRLLKMNDITKEIPIIMITARTGSQDRERGLEMGADAYIPKPADMPTLLAKISEVTRKETKNEAAPSADEPTPPDEK
ncbi:MAG: response regulator [candidate division WOR-3 bacterium]